MYTCISCKDNGCNVISTSTFKTTLDLSTSLQLERGSHNWSYADGGACGLIVYNNGDNLVAYDRCSNTSKSKVKVEGFLAIDDQSGAKWLLLDGSPAAVAECPLQRYTVKKVGQQFVIEN